MMQQIAPYAIRTIFKWIIIFNQLNKFTIIYFTLELKFTRTIRPILVIVLSYPAVYNQIKAA